MLWNTIAGEAHRREGGGAQKGELSACTYGEEKNLESDCKQGTASVSSDRVSLRVKPRAKSSH